MNGLIYLTRINGDANQMKGTMVVPDQLFGCLTLERGDNDNKQGISCIPVGEYNWIKRAATKAIPYEHILLLNVPGREGVCIHTGNHYYHSKGCVLVGNSFADINKDGEDDVLSSKDTFAALMSKLPAKGKLIIDN